MPNPENLKGKGFKENPQNINKKGRPRKSFSTINESLLAKGIEKLTKSDLLDAYALIFNLNDNDLKELEEDEENIPLAFQTIIKELSNDNTRARAMQDFRDYLFGRAVENIEVNKSVVIFELPSNGRETDEAIKIPTPPPEGS